jgi:hypothetical protein
MIINVVLIIFACLILPGIKCQPETESQENAKADKNPLQMVISEVNLNSYLVFTENQEFFEFHAMKSGQRKHNQNFKGFSTQGYKIILISTGDKNLPINSVSLEMYADLHNSRTNPGGYLVIGGPAVPNVNFEIKEEYAKKMLYYHRNAGQGITKFFTNKYTDQKIYAICLCYVPVNERVNNHFAIAGFKFGDQQYKRLKTNDIQIIKNYLIDMVVFASLTAPTDRCQVFEELHEQFAIPVQVKYILRDANLYKKDQTINRCSWLSVAFCPESYRLGSPTPGDLNDCNGPTFVLEDLITRDSMINPETFAAKEVNSEPVLQIEEENLCNPHSHTSIEYESLRVQTNDESLLKKSEETNKQLLPILESRGLYPPGDACLLAQEAGINSKEADTLSVLDTFQNRKRKFSNDVDQGILEFESDLNFKEEWLEMIKTHQNKLIPIKSVEINKVWFEYLPNNTYPADSHYRCRICSSHKGILPLDSRRFTALMKPEGILRNTYEKNRVEITGHSKTETHILILQYLRKLKVRRVGEELSSFQKEMEHRELVALEVTNRMFRTVFVEIKLNLPFSSHPKLVSLQERNGIDMGNQHYSRFTANKITIFISNVMQQTLVEHIMESSSPLSVIVDGSTDNQKHFLAVLIQSMEDYHPVVYFYKLIPIPSDETAQSLANIMIQSFENEKPGFSDVVRSKLVGFASDGASVMMGEHNGLLQKLKTWKGKNIYGIHCMAHRLQLAIRKPMERFEFMNVFELFVNDIYKFYGGHGHKNKAHLVEFANTFEETVLNYNYIFKVRWISSEMIALKKIFTTWSLLSRHLKSIFDPSSVPTTTDGELPYETHFSRSSKETAQLLQTKLTNRHYVMLLAFLLDVLNLLSLESKAMQKRDAILVGQNKYKLRFLNGLTTLKSKNGHFTSFVLANSACSNIENQVNKYLWNEANEPLTPTGTDGCRDIKNFEKSPYIVFKGEKLSSLTSPARGRSQQSTTSQSLSELGNVPGLSSFRIDFIDGLVREINNYFPSGNLKDFEIFDPINWPNKEGLLNTYGLQEIAQLCNFFQIDNGIETSQEWTEIIVKIKEDTTIWCTIKDSSIVAFWRNVLKRFEVGNSIKLLIETVLVLPIGSADAERSFSIMNHIRNKRRSRLSDEAMDALIRVRFNGPDDLEKFNPTKYCKKWLAAGHLRSDGGPSVFKQNTLQDDEEMSKKILGESSLF